MLPSSKTQLKNVLVKTETVESSSFMHNFWAVVIKNLVIFTSSERIVEIVTAGSASVYSSAYYIMF